MKQNYLLKKAVSLIVVLFFASIAIFLIIHLIPGNAADVMTAGSTLSEEQMNKLLADMGIDKPLIEQYFIWLGNVLNGNFGTSLYSNEAVTSLILPRFVATLKLAFISMLLAVGIGVPCGIVAAIKHNSFFDVIIMLLTIIGISMPIFWLGLLLVMKFSINLGWLPASGADSWVGYILPAITISLNIMANIARMTRSSMLEVLGQDYMRTAEAKGMPFSCIIWKHGLKNALIPIITVIGTQFGYLMGGAVLTETVFVFPGIGKFLIDSINRRDYPSVQACMLLITLMFAIINMCVDIAYHYADPRVKA